VVEDNNLGGKYMKSFRDKGGGEICSAMAPAVCSDILGVVAFS
jgi:hypothetical protein